MDFSQVNYLSIFLAALSYFILGSIWYNPSVFGSTWQKESGLSDDDIKNANMAKIFGTSFLLTLIINFNLELFLGNKIDATTGLFYGFLTGFGWVAMSMGVNDLFERRSMKLYLINAGYHIVAYSLSGLILGLM